MKPDTEPNIQVGIQIDSKIEFELKGDFHFKEETISPGIYEASLENDIIRTGFTQSKKINLHPSLSTSTFILKKVCIGIGFHWEQNEDQEFEGGFSLQIEGNKIRVVNNVPLEKYLKSVISSEMSAMNDLNLLKAHAIVSRSWLLAQIQKKSEYKQTTDCFDSTKASTRNDVSIEEITKWYDREDHSTFDVCADDHCQRYQGITKVISENATAAIDYTRGMVLTFDHQICDARFSKCCGGKSEDFENVWQPVHVPYLVSVQDTLHKAKPVKPDLIEEFIQASPSAFCNTTDPEILKQVLIDFDRSTSDFFRWELSYSQKEISKLIRNKSGVDFGEIIDLIPVLRGKSGRIIKLQIVGSKKNMVVGKELEIRKWLSETHLYSSAFVLEKQYPDLGNIPSSFLIKGAGWGHGVGMCQIGAAVMSQKGYSYLEILKHYFCGVDVEPIY